jgi:Flp pilus assembly pilin Flp
MQQRTARRKRPEDGGSLVEYVLLVSLIVVVCLVSIGYFGNSVNDRFSKATSTIQVSP